MKTNEKLVCYVVLVACYLIALHHAARFTMAPGVRFSGDSSDETADSMYACAHMTLEAGGVAYGYCDGNGTCMIYTKLLGYAEGNDGCYFYTRKDDQPDECVTESQVASVLHDTVYDNGNCPTDFTYNSTEEACYSSMSESDCNKYSATWKYTYMPDATYPCALYPSSQTSYVDDYACQNYGSTLQIFKGNAYCYSRIAVPSSMNNDSTLVTTDGCSWLYDVDSHTVIVETQLEIDWLYATFGEIMLGAYGTTTWGMNFANNYKFYDNSSASSFLSQSSIMRSTAGFMYAAGTMVNTTNKLPGNYILCKYDAVSAQC
uniref:Fibrinogen C-terminal domain-containing protein n=1 Tax=Bursaphelenchus xylophilus TaxID=6326 RepID=A0A1I7S1K1_BURXY